MIEPHGGELLNLMSDPPKNGGHLEPSIVLNKRSLADLEMLATGALSPLRGFISKLDYESILLDFRLSSGLVWTLPVILPITEEDVKEIGTKEEVYLKSPNRELMGKVNITDIFRYDKLKEARSVYGTTDVSHPGVAALFSQGDHYLGGDVEVYSLPEREEFKESRHTPAELRLQFQARGWKRVVGFQTRNPIHRAHEYITKCALEMVDGLLIHPIVGQTSKDDIPAGIRMECYRAILENYFPHRHTFLSVYPAFMRYAGPREAVFHAITRKNYGCTHFIVGRDHAGYRDFYGTYDAQEIFNGFSREELGIEPLFFEHAFYCKRTNSMATTKTSRAMDHEKVFLSGTKVREILASGGELQEEFTRPEVEAILKRYYRNER